MSKNSTMTRRRDKSMKMRIEGLLIALLLFSGCAGLQFDRNGSSAVESEVLAKSTSSWDGNLLQGYPEGQPEITIIRIKIPPGASLPMHKHPVINTGVLVKGSLTVETKDGKKLYLNEGDAKWK